MNRREFSAGCLAIAGTALLRETARPESLTALPPWREGELHIHQIDTGRGNACFLIFPDATTMLIDCGTSNDDLSVSAPRRPDSSRRPGEWVARYAMHHAPAANRDRIDYALVTHIHPDHVGDIPPGMSASADGYIPTGISQVDSLMSIDRVIDRGFPDYGPWQPLKAPFATNYLAWLKSRVRRGRAVVSAQVGSAEQIAIRRTNRFPDFSVRVISANGTVWTGAGRESRSAFPPPKEIPANDWPDENLYSVAIHLRYGRFSYYSGGDLEADTRDGRLPWRDVESRAAEVVGQTEVAVANHHAYFDACGPAFTKQLDAQAYIIPAWHVTHPGQAQLQRLLGAWPGNTIRDVFATEMLGANCLFNARWATQLRSRQGHVVVRVAPGGDSYRIFVLDSLHEDAPVVYSSGTYLCRNRAQ